MARDRSIHTPLEAPDGRWQAVALDLVSLEVSEEGYDAVVVFTDMFTKQIFCAPVRLKGMTAEKVAELFVSHVFRTQGLPKVLLSDRDPKFTSGFWGRLFELLGTGLKFSASYHHQTNWQVERVNDKDAGGGDGYASPLLLSLLLSHNLPDGHTSPHTQASARRIS
jgi:hypothetical protein